MMESRTPGSEMPIDDERNGHEILANPIPAEPAAANAALGSRFDQMFPVLSEPTRFCSGVRRTRAFAPTGPRSPRT
jgi:hypothetical protein